MQNNYDEIIKKALLVYEKKDDVDIPSKDKIDHIFSEKYLKKKEKLLKMVDKSYYHFVNTAAKRVAVFMVCLILACSSVLTVDAARERIVEFFYKVYSNYTDISGIYDSNNKQLIETPYTLKELPKGFFLFDELTDSGVKFFVWRNAQNQQIWLTQFIFSTSSAINSENAQVVETVINNTGCLFIEQKFEYIYVWEFDGYIFQLEYPIELGEEFAESVIGKLVEYKK